MAEMNSQSHQTEPEPEPKAVENPVVVEQIEHLSPKAVKNPVVVELSKSALKKIEWQRMQKQKRDFRLYTADVCPEDQKKIFEILAAHEIRLTQKELHLTLAYDPKDPCVIAELSKWVGTQIKLTVVACLQGYGNTIVRVVMADEDKCLYHNGKNHNGEKERKPHLTLEFATKAVLAGLLDEDDTEMVTVTPLDPFEVTATLTLFTGK